MTITLAYDPAKPQPTRPQTNDLVDSQRPERYQAVDIPDIWPVPVSAGLWRILIVAIIGAIAVAVVVTL